MGCTTSTSTMAEKVTSSGTGTNFLSTDLECFSPLQKKIIKRTWKNMAHDMTGIGVKVFLRIFQINPTIKLLFPFCNLPDDQLADDYLFKAHATRFMQTVSAIVENIDSIHVNVAPVLISLGRKHVDFKGFKPAYWEFFVQGMMSIWANELGIRFTADAQVTWNAVFHYIMEKLREGYKLAQKEQTTNNNIVPQTH